MVVGYIGPDATIPIASSLAAGLGLALIMWSRIVSVFRSVTRKKNGKTK